MLRRADVLCPVFEREAWRSVCTVAVVLRDVSAVYRGTHVHSMIYDIVQLSILIDLQNIDRNSNAALPASASLFTFCVRRPAQQAPELSNGVSGSEMHVTNTTISQTGTCYRLSSSGGSPISRTDILPASNNRLFLCERNAAGPPSSTSPGHPAPPAFPCTSPDHQAPCRRITGGSACIARTSSRT